MLKYFAVTTMVLCLLTFNALSQRVITAKVINSNTNQPVKNADVSIEGSTATTITNPLGFFQLTADTSDYFIIEKQGYEQTMLRVPAIDNFTIAIRELDRKKYVEVNDEYEKGFLKDGYKAGIWEYYDKPGKLSLKINYDTGALLYMAEDTTEYAVEIDGIWTLKRVDIQPRYIGSMYRGYKFMTSKIRYPSKARDHRTTGTVYISFEIDTTGRASEFRIINDLGNETGKMALEATLAIPNFWIPARIDGKKYKSRFIVPFNYIMEEDGGANNSAKNKYKEELPLAKSMPKIDIKAYSVVRTISGPGSFR